MLSGISSAQGGAMIYQQPTGAEWLVVLAALVGPLVYAYKRHGDARMVALMAWMPLWLFVTRMALYRPITQRSWDYQWGITASYNDPLTFAWPLFVLAVYGPIWLFRRSPSKPGRSVGSAGGYDDYLQSPAWQQQRREAIQRAGGRCQVCNSSGPLEVHHRTYQRLGREAPGDLTVLCRACHARFHEGGRMPVRR